MFNWLRKLLGSFDRQQAAADRAAVALEEIALDLESVRDALRVRLNAEVVPALEESSLEIHTNGRRKLTKGGA